MKSLSSVRFRGTADDMPQSTAGSGSRRQDERPRSAPASAPAHRGLSETAPNMTDHDVPVTMAVDGHAAMTVAKSDDLSAIGAVAVEFTRAPVRAATLYDGQKQVSASDEWAVAGHPCAPEVRTLCKT